MKNVIITEAGSDPSIQGQVKGKEITNQAIHNLLEQMEQNGDREHAEKLKQLLAKAESGQLNLAFCGHFSAGKSSLINRLCGHQLLPSSPIPTSANIVSIASGEAGAQVIYRQEAGNTGEPRSERVPLEELEAHCRNGEAIETVVIHYPIPLLGEHTALLDTPGIDSTDDAHQLATESALHLADVVFYVMDYNHVQSEINLAFTKKMTEWGKPLYLIVNMIDKHREHEVSLKDYQEGVRNAFLHWGVRPDGILYTSVKVPDHPASEWGKLDWLLSGLIGRREALMNQSLEKSARALALSHAAKAAEANDGLRAGLQARLAEDEGVSEAQEEHVRTLERVQKLQKVPEQLLLQTRKEVTALLDNANVIPAVIRDLAHTYLESRKPGFKVGWLGSAAKTAAERESRLQAFYKDFASQVDTQVARHVQLLLKGIWEGQGLPAERVASAAAEIRFVFTPQWLAGHVNEAASFGSEYTLTYSKHIAAEVKGAYRQLAFAAAEALTAELGAALGPEIDALQLRLSALDSQLSVLRELEELAAREEAYRASLLAPLPQSPAAALPSLQDAPAAEQSAPADSGAPEAAAALAWLAQPGARSAEPAGASAGRHRERLRDTAAQLRAASEELSGIAALQSIRRSLAEKAGRLADNRFTIALFGAFSAGKSSFANALIGERVLPVSPNPTTAAINKIMPPEPEAGWPHGTAKVCMKSRERLESDVLYSLEVLGYPASSLEQALTSIGKLQAERIPGKGKPHYAFLRAVQQGWEEMSGKLGQELRITSNEFGSYAADEAKSCFVELIELYYSNPLTEQGVVLVDTPGADSINARHTGVAFDFIKNADAILFVTYYNHAFSHADKQFLMQLGRVKDSFELDKMFFIVNAADLASSPEELEGVVAHVESNLLQHGIRHPRIYPLSSYYALQGKMSGDTQVTASSGIERFEQEFIRFTFEELTDMAVRAGEGDIRRAADMLHHWIDSARSDAAVRESEKRSLQEALKTNLNRLQEVEQDVDQKELADDMRELLYYVKQRSTYRFGDFFNLAFNPAVFREDQRDPRAVLESAWNDLRRMISFDLTQEILATTLRIENKINRLAEQASQRWTETIQKDIPAFEPQSFDAFKLQTPQLEAQLQADEIGAKWLASFFKNAKHFFEGDGKAQLRRELEVKLNEPMNRFIEAQDNSLNAFYMEQLRDVIRSLASTWSLSLEEQAGGLLDALDMNIDLNELQGKHERLQRYLQA